MSGSEQGAEFLYLIGALVLVCSALLSRRLPLGKTLKLAAIWIAIFAGAFVLFSLKDPIVELARTVASERRAESVGVQVGDALEIKQSLDGHYWVDGTLNDQPVRFLVDSGATTTSISGATARRAGIKMDTGFPVMVQTANGMVAVERGRAGRLKVGQIVRTDFPVHISDGFGETNVLGMNFLSSLSGWGVERNRLILKP